MSYNYTQHGNIKSIYIQKHSSNKQQTHHKHQLHNDKKKNNSDNKNRFVVVVDMSRLTRHDKSKRTFAHSLIVFVFVENANKCNYN